METDENGEEKITYQERPVGVIKKDYTIEYDKEAGVNRAVIQGISGKDIVRTAMILCSVDNRLIVVLN